MVKVTSTLRTSMAYDGGPEAKKRQIRRRVELHPGVNEVSDGDMDLLAADPFFQRHAGRGFFTVADTPKVKPAPQPVAVAAINPRDKLPGEKDNAYKKRMAALDAEEAKAGEKAALDQLVTDFLAMSEEDQATMLPGLADNERAAIEAAKVAK